MPPKGVGFPDPHRSKPTIYAAPHESVRGTHSPFAALHKSGSFRGFICRAFDTDGPTDRDQYLSKLPHGVQPARPHFFVGCREPASGPRQASLAESSAGRWRDMPRTPHQTYAARRLFLRNDEQVEGQPE